MGNGGEEEKGDGLQWEKEKELTLIARFSSKNQPIFGNEPQILNRDRQIYPQFQTIPNHPHKDGPLTPAPCFLFVYDFLRQQRELSNPARLHRRPSTPTSCVRCVYTVHRHNTHSVIPPTTRPIR